MFVFGQQLQPTAGNGQLSQTVNFGEHLILSGNFGSTPTIILPPLTTSTINGGPVAITNNSNQMANISGNGQSILGMGNSGTSITLAQNGVISLIAANITISGTQTTNWYVLSLTQPASDTGWTKIGLGPDVSANSFYRSLAYRVIGNVVYFRGGVNLHGGTPWTLGTLPSTVWPSNIVLMPVVLLTTNDTYATGYASVDPNPDRTQGQLSVDIGESGASVSAAFLDGTFYVL